jgi:predicted O-methyltransferase YrrM
VSPPAFAPIGNIPCPRVDLRGTRDPVPAILSAPEFSETVSFFRRSPSADRSLLTDVGQALLFSLIRNLRPAHVVEIGTYKGGTAEGLSRALHANGAGTLHTISPHDAERFGPLFAQWPEELRRHTVYYPVDSMMFFMQADEKQLRFDLVLVDGHHDYEFANFDIQSAARRLMPGGFIAIDNVAQAGPYRATCEFLAAHPGWRDCGVRSGSREMTKAFDRDRTRIPDTDFYILRAPFAYLVDKNPVTFGSVDWGNRPLAGLRLSLGNPRVRGTLHVQCILRAFSDTRIDELVASVSCTIDGGSDKVDIAFEQPLAAAGPFQRFLVEPWLIWQGEMPLPLTAPPVPY